jgi:putative phosphoribosyl transferase
MHFKDRVDAGRRLATALENYRGKDVVVYALPRGGVVLGYEIARALSAPLDLIITRKIGYPGNPECALCAVSEEGRMICDRSGISLISDDWIKSEAQKEIMEAKRRRETYLAGRQPLPAEEKVAIVVDDGVATGLTLLLAVQVLRDRHPRKVVVAVPVASEDAVEKLREVADELVVLEVPPYFEAVGAYYQQFPQLTDEEVKALMRASGNG